MGRLSRQWPGSGGSIGARLSAMPVERTVGLCFGDAARATGTHTNLSAVRSDGPVLWVAGDETATIERLVADDPAAPKRYAEQTSFRLADLVDLPGDDADEEADIEGLARHGPFLWAVGSHSLRRRRIKAKHQGEKALRRLAMVTGQANRQVLVRIPVREVDGLPTLVRELVVDGDTHRAATFGAHGTDLRDLLADDEHLAAVPADPRQGQRSGRRGHRRRRGARVPRPARTGAAGMGRGPGAAPVRGPRCARSAGAAPVRGRPPLPQARAPAGRPGRPRPLPARERSAGPGRADHGPRRPGARLPVARRAGGRDAAGRAGRAADPGARPPLRRRRRTTRRGSGWSGSGCSSSTTAPPPSVWAATDA